jgi:hypothetical protein
MAQVCYEDVIGAAERSFGCYKDQKLDKRQLCVMLMGNLDKRRQSSLYQVVTN